MGAEIKQYNGSFVSPKDDATMYEKFHCETGVVKGVEITHMGTNQILVGAGYIYIPGRMVEIEEETVLCELQTEETEGELILYVDLSADTPATLLARAPRVELTQEDINDSGTVYEFLLATFTIDDTVISDLAVAYGELRPNLPMSQTGDAYDSEADYDAGALFIKDNALCKATEALVGGEHDESKIEKTTIAAEISSLNGKTSPVLLWENASPTASFAAQTIELTDTVEQFEWIEVIFYLTYSSYRINKIYYGTDASLIRMSFSQMRKCVRTFNFSGNTCVIGSSTYVYVDGSTSYQSGTDNSNAIPRYIIGHYL